MRDCGRRDRLLFIAALADALLKLLRAAGEAAERVRFFVYEGLGAEEGLPG